MKILLVQTSFLGDTILSTPVIAGLARIYPDAEIVMMTTPVSMDLVRNDPLVSRVISHDKRSRESGLGGLVRKAAELRTMGFDAAYSLHRSFRTSMLLYLSGIPVRVGFQDSRLSTLYTDARPRHKDGHAVISNLSLLFGDLEPEHLSTDMRLVDAGEAALSAEAAGAVNRLSSYAILAPGSAWKTKQWHWQGYARVAGMLADAGLGVILIGGRADQEVCSRISRKTRALDLSGRVPLSDTLTLVRKSRLMVCNDSMALHMASAFKRPTVAVFCATSPGFGFGPWNNPDAIVVEREDLDCKPCRRHGSQKCPNGTDACMTLEPATVMTAIRRLLDQSHAKAPELSEEAP